MSQGSGAERRGGSDGAASGGGRGARARVPIEPGPVYESDAAWGRLYEDESWQPYSVGMKPSMHERVAELARAAKQLGVPEGCDTQQAIVHEALARFLDVAQQEFELPIPSVRVALDAAQKRR